MSDAIEAVIQFEEFACGECGIRFRVPFDLSNGYRKRGAFMHCPNGHENGWSKTAAELEADNLRKRVASLREEVDRSASIRFQQVKTIANLRGQITKLKNRIAGKPE